MRLLHSSSAAHSRTSLPSSLGKTCTLLYVLNNIPVQPALLKHGIHFGYLAIFSILITSLGYTAAKYPSHSFKISYYSHNSATLAFNLPDLQA